MQALTKLTDESRCYDNWAHAEAAGFQRARDRQCVATYRGVRITLTDASGPNSSGYRFRLRVMHPTEQDCNGAKTVLLESEVVTVPIWLNHELNKLNKPGCSATMVSPTLLGPAMDNVRAAIDEALKQSTIEVGDRVEGGEPGTEDHDTGVVLSIVGQTATVGWDSCVRTKADLNDLRLERPNQ